MPAASAASAVSVELAELSELAVWELEEALCSQLFEDNNTDSRS